MKTKQCTVCGSSYIPTGRCAKYCSGECRKSAAKKRWQETSPRYKGCGSGGAQKRGPEHHSYKTGIATYAQFRKEACEVCASVQNLCVHHKDHNRENNASENLITLCKRCHQLTHDCTANLPKEMSDAKRKWQSEHMRRLNATLLRDKSGRLQSGR